MLQIKQSKNDLKQLSATASSNHKFQIQCKIWELITKVGSYWLESTILGDYGNSEWLKLSKIESRRK